MEIDSVEHVGRQAAPSAEDDWVFREYMRMALACLAFASTLGLGWLVLTHQPLPAGGSSLVCSRDRRVLSPGDRLCAVRAAPAVLSFPSLLLVVTFMFTCSPLLLYQFQGPGSVS